MKKAQPGVEDRQDSISSEFDVLAEAFRRETGITAPGKDRAPAEGDDGVSRGGRVRRWRRWLEARDAETDRGDGRLNP